MRLIRRLASDRKGATAIEYGLIGALISVAIIGGLQAFAAEGTGVFNVIAQLPDASLAELLYGFRQYRAVADCMIDLLDTELDRRNGDLDPLGPKG